MGRRNNGPSTGHRNNGPSMGRIINGPYTGRMIDWPNMGRTGRILAVNGLELESSVHGPTITGHRLSAVFDDAMKTDQHINGPQMGRL